MAEGVDLMEIFRHLVVPGGARRGRILFDPVDFVEEFPRHQMVAVAPPRDDVGQLVLEGRLGDVGGEELSRIVEEFAVGVGSVLVGVPRVVRSGPHRVDGFGEHPVVEDAELDVDAVVACEVEGLVEARHVGLTGVVVEDVVPEDREAPGGHPDAGVVHPDVAHPAEPGDVIVIAAVARGIPGDVLSDGDVGTAVGIGEVALVRFIDLHVAAVVGRRICFDGEFLLEGLDHGAVDLDVEVRGKRAGLAGEVAEAELRVVLGDVAEDDRDVPGQDRDVPLEVVRAVDGGSEGDLAVLLIPERRDLLDIPGGGGHVGVDVDLLIVVDVVEGAFEQFEVGLGEGEFDLLAGHRGGCQDDEVIEAAVRLLDGEDGDGKAEGDAFERYFDDLRAGDVGVPAGDHRHREGDRLEEDAIGVVDGDRSAAQRQFVAELVDRLLRRGQDVGSDHGDEAGGRFFARRGGDFRRSRTDGKHEAFGGDGRDAFVAGGEDDAGSGGSDGPCELRRGARGEPQGGGREVDRDRRFRRGCGGRPRDAAENGGCGEEGQDDQGEFFDGHGSTFFCSDF